MLTNLSSWLSWLDGLRLPLVLCRPVVQPGAPVHGSFKGSILSPHDSLPPISEPCYRIFPVYGGSCLDFLQDHFSRQLVHRQKSIASCLGCPKRPAPAPVSESCREQAASGFLKRQNSRCPTCWAFCSLLPECRRRGGPNPEVDPGPAAGPENISRL